jgi:predicted nucleic-acid-binding Zn-ribbon protein
VANRTGCPHCGGTNLFSRGDIAAGGPYGPNLLPDAGGLLFAPRMMAVVCKDCGFIRFFAEPKTLARIDSGHGWERLI